MQNVGSAANWIERTARKSDEKLVASRAFDAARNISVQQILSEHPSEPADWSHDQVYLPHSRQAVAGMGAGPGTVFVPWRAHLGAIFLNCQFAERADAPLRTGCGIPHGCLESAPPVFARVGKFQFLALGIILNLNEARHRALNRMSHVVVK